MNTDLASSPPSTIRAAGRRLTVGHYVSVVSRRRGFERNVSGHIQIPLRVMQLLADQGHDVHLITNEFGDDRVLPWCMPEPATVHYVKDSRRRLGSLEDKRSGYTTRGVYPLAFFQQLQQMKRIAEDHAFDILHLHGYGRTAMLAPWLKLIGLRVPTLVTLSGRADRYPMFMWKRVGPIVTATEYAAETARRRGLDVHIIRHGVVREILRELPEGWSAERRRVLFWRDLTETNGADLCLHAYDELAPAYPDVLFTIAVRTRPTEVPGADELCRRHANVELYRFPYPEGISLAQLMSESICVLLPFRRLSILPQLAIAESLAAGVPVIASNTQSTPELITSGRNGWLAPIGDAGATTNALREVLSNPDAAAEMAIHAAEDFRARWNWDSYAQQLERVYECAISRSTRNASL